MTAPLEVYRDDVRTNAGRMACRIKLASFGVPGGTLILPVARFSCTALSYHQRQEDEIGGGGATCPAVVKDIEQRDELGGGLLVAGRRGMVVTGRIIQGIHPRSEVVLDGSPEVTVMIAGAG